MAELIPQSIAKRVPLKVYLSDGTTDATGKTVAVVISKNGAAFGNPSVGATTAVEIANGWYYADLSTTDTGTTGPLIVRGTATGCDNSEWLYTVAVDTPAAIKAKTDSLTFTVANQVNANVFHMQDDVITADAVAADAIDTDALETGIADAVVAATVPGDATPDSVGGLLNSAAEGGGAPTVDDIWSAVVPASYAAGSAGYDVSLIPDIKAKTDTLGASAVTVTQPVVSNQTMYLTQGDDYLAVDGRALDFTYSGQPDFTSGSAVLKFTYLNSTTALLSVAGSIYSSTTVRFQPTRTDTATLPVESALQQNQLAFEVQVTLSDGSVMTPTTLQAGRCTVSRQAL